MSYKVNIEKGVKLLRSVSPPIIFINGMIASGKEEFIQLLKEEGFSTIKFKSITQIQQYLKNRKGKFDHMPLIIDANINDAKMISDIFTDEFHNFTYVFMYPNEQKEFSKRLNEKLPNYKHEEYEIVPSNFGVKKNNDVLDFLKINREIYNNHLEFFEERILTILT